MDALNDDAISCIHIANLVTSARRENSVSWYAYITLLLILKEFVNPERSCMKMICKLRGAMRNKLPEITNKLTVHIM